ncbi:MAG: hypothetical protein Q7J25_11365 [Vicinamibacterales bacterium]|nr:hypothetical protein [Vicinamibacterales bacterium]
MKLKPIIDDTTQVIGPLREFYAKGEDGKYHLSLDGEPPGYVKADKLAEFRSKNIALMQQAAKFEGVDLDAAKAAIAKVAAFGDLDPVAAKAALAKVAAGDADADDVVKLKLDLATAQGTAASAQAKADRGVLREKLRDKLLAAGVLPAALDIALDKAEPIFTVKDDVLIAKAGGPASVDEWILSATSDFAFLFAPSRGGGSGGAKPSVLGASAANVLRNPSPQDLGKYAAEIKSGKMKIEITT